MLYKPGDDPKGEEGNAGESHTEPSIHRLDGDGSRVTKDHVELVSQADALLEASAQKVRQA